MSHFTHSFSVHYVRPSFYQKLFSSSSRSFIYSLTNKISFSSLRPLLFCSLLSASWFYLSRVFTGQALCRSTLQILSFLWFYFVLVAFFVVPILSRQSSLVKLTLKCRWKILVQKQNWFSQVKIRRISTFTGEYQQTNSRLVYVRNVS